MLKRIISGLRNIWSDKSVDFTSVGAPLGDPKKTGKINSVTNHGISTGKTVKGLHNAIMNHGRDFMNHGHKI